MNKFKYTVKTPILTASGEIEATSLHAAKLALVEPFNADVLISIEIIKPEVKKWIVQYAISPDEGAYIIEADTQEAAEMLLREDLEEMLENQTWYEVREYSVDLVERLNIDE